MSTPQTIHTKNKSQWDDLPDVILLSITDFLEMDEICRYETVSKYISDLITQSSIYKQYCEKFLESWQEMFRIREIKKALTSYSSDEIQKRFGLTMREFQRIGANMIPKSKPKFMSWKYFAICLHYDLFNKTVTCLWLCGVMGWKTPDYWTDITDLRINMNDPKLKKFFVMIIIKRTILMMVMVMMMMKKKMLIKVIIRILIRGS